MKEVLVLVILILTAASWAIADDRPSSTDDLAPRGGGSDACRAQLKTVYNLLRDPSTGEEHKANLLHYLWFQATTFSYDVELKGGVRGSNAFDELYLLSIEKCAHRSRDAVMGLWRVPSRSK